MKKCPNCQTSYDNDNLKFCQNDGTSLVIVAELSEDDPYKIIVGNQADNSGIIAEQDKKKVESAEMPADPFQTMVAPPPSDSKKEPEETAEDDILDLGEDDGDEIDPMETMVISSSTIDYIKVDVPEENQTEDYSASSFDDTKSNAEADLDAADSDETPAQIESIDEPQFGQIDNKDFTDDDTSFDKPTSPEYAPPSTSPFEPAKESLKPEAQNERQSEPPVSPFAEPETSKLDNPADDWSVLDPAFSGNENPGLGYKSPIGDWGNNEITANSPSGVVAPATDGQNMILSYISLGTGILSMTLCCFIGVFLGPAGIVTGYLARKNIAENPNLYGGDKFALIGMITGVAGFLIGVGLIILSYFLGG